MSEHDEKEIEDIVKSRATSIANQVVGRLFWAFLIGAFVGAGSIIGGVWWLSAKFSSYEATISQLQEEVRRVHGDQGNKVERIDTRISRLEDWKWDAKFQIESNAAYLTQIEGRFQPVERAYWRNRQQ